MRRKLPRVVVPAVLGAALLLAAPGGLRAQVVEDVFPLDPPDGATVGPRSQFKVGVRGSDITKMRFRIALSQDDFDTEAFVFDQIKDRNGWAFVAEWDEHPGAVYFPRKPIPDGEYVWTAWAWNGLSWTKSDTVFRLRVDAVPPADVEGLRMSVDPETRAVVLKWNPVTVDQNGRPEYVKRYHVYRFDLKAPFFFMRMFEAGVTGDTEYLDRDPRASASSLVFYAVTAEDLAGNRPGVKSRY